MGEISLGNRFAGLRINPGAAARQPQHGHPRPRGAVVDRGAASCARHRCRRHSSLERDSPQKSSIGSRQRDPRSRGLENLARLAAKPRQNCPDPRAAGLQGRGWKSPGTVELPGGQFRDLSGCRTGWPAIVCTCTMRGAAPICDWRAASACSVTGTGTPPAACLGRRSKIVQGRSRHCGRSAAQEILRARPPAGVQFARAHCRPMRLRLRLAHCAGSASMPIAAP